MEEKTTSARLSSDPKIVGPRKYMLSGPLCLDNVYPASNIPELMIYIVKVFFIVITHI